MTWLPSLWNASASPRPIPELPPVMKIVLDCILIEMGTCHDKTPKSLGATLRANCRRLKTIGVSEPLRSDS